MIFIKLSQVLALIICLLSSSIAQADGGRAGTGGAGGDLAKAELNSIRSMVIAALQKVVANTGTDEGKAAVEKTLKAFCTLGPFGSLPEEVRNSCVDFIISNSHDILTCVEGNDKVKVWAVAPKTEEEEREFEIPYPTPTKFQKVTARTNLGCETGLNIDDNDVYFHYERARGLSNKALFILLAHEFGHKVTYDIEHSRSANKILIEDSTMVNGMIGTDFLTTIGAALYFYGLAAPSVFDEKALNEFKPRWQFFNCQITAKGFLPSFFSFSTTVDGSSSNYLSHTDSENGPGYEITELTKNIFPNERLFIKAEFQERATCDAQMPGDFSLVQVLAPDREKTVLASFFRPKNLLCELPPPVIQLQYEDMNIECRYHGKYFF